MPHCLLDALLIRLVLGCLAVPGVSWEVVLDTAGPMDMHQDTTIVGRLEDQRAGSAVDSISGSMGEPPTLMPMQPQIKKVRLRRASAARFQVPELGSLLEENWRALEMKTGPSTILGNGVVFGCGVRVCVVPLRAVLPCHPAGFSSACE